MQSTIYIIKPLFLKNIYLKNKNKKQPRDLSDSTIYNGVLKTRYLLSEFLYQRLIRMNFPKDENYFTNMDNLGEEWLGKAFERRGESLR